MSRLQTLQQRKLQLVLQAASQREQLRAGHASLRGELMLVGVGLGVVRLLRAPKATLLATVASVAAGWLLKRFANRP